jgi:Domain of unknown function (DUF4331)
MSTPRALVFGLVTALAGGALPSAAAAMLIVEAVVTPVGGSFEYAVHVDNGLADDVVIVSFVDAPVGDPLIEGTLAAPAGFLASYDDGLGFVDLFEDSAFFAAGTDVAGFSWTSSAAPGPGVFESFEALTALGDLVSGSVLVTLVPEPRAELLLGIGLLGLALFPAARRGRRARALLLAGLGLLSAGHARASSHADAPLIKQDPQANLTDVYAFIGTRFDDPSELVLNVLVSVRPFSDPGDGGIYDRFADDALYSIHITDPSTGAPQRRYDFRFSSISGGLKNADTILSYGEGSELGPITSIGDARQNFTQTYSVVRNGTSLGSGLPVPPPNLGKRVTPPYNDSVTGKAVSGASNAADLDPLTAQAVRDLAGDHVAFAGPRDDGFYADTPGVFDLLDPRILDNDGDVNDGFGQDGAGVDGFRGFNVLAYGLQIPLAELTAASYVDPVFGNAATGVGVYASVSRRRLTIRRSNGGPLGSGPWVQVNRMGNPLFNEGFVSLGDKDRYNRTAPAADAQFESHALAPALAHLVDQTFIGLPQSTLGNRVDLAAIFIPDVLRVDTTTPAVRLPGQAGFSRLGYLGGDLTSGSGGPRSAGWPNGRRVGDDVVDVTLTDVIEFGELVGDNVAANDQIYNQVFPYLATPHAGPTVDQRSAP